MRVMPRLTWRGGSAVIPLMAERGGHFANHLMSANSRRTAGAKEANQKPELLIVVCLPSFVCLLAHNIQWMPLVVPPGLASLWPSERWGWGVGGKVKLQDCIYVKCPSFQSQKITVTLSSPSDNVFSCVAICVLARFASHK